MQLFPCPSEIIEKNQILKNKGVIRLFFWPQLNMTVKFPVQKVGLEKKSGFCFSNLLYKGLEKVRKYGFAKFRYL